MSNLLDRIAALPPEKRALLARQIQKPEALPQKPPCVRQPRDTKTFPLSFAQERHWFLYQWDPTSPLYTIVYAFRLEGVLDTELMRASTALVVQRHEALRTTFTVIDGVPHQVIGDVGHDALEQFDVGDAPPDECERRMHELALREIRRPFNLATGPLFRLLLIRLSEREHVLISMVHHIIFDGWSAGVLIREMSALMTASLAAGDEGITAQAVLPALPIQYADFAVWQRTWLQGPVLEQQLAYWKEQLSGPLPILELPTDRPYSTANSAEGARCERMLPRALARKLAELTQEEGVTLFMTLLTAWLTLLHRYSRQEEILVGTPIANRALAETEPLIGCIANTLVLRSDLSGNPSFREALQRVRRVTLAAYDHQDVPFEKVVEALQSERDLHHSPLFQVMFVLQQDAVKTLESPSLAVSPLPIHTQTAKFALTLEASQIEHDLRLTLEYKTALFDTASVERILEHYQILLEAIVAEPTKPIGLLTLMSERERRLLLEAWQGAPPLQDAGRCLHELFTEQALRMPQAVAASFDGAQLRYDELNRRANQLAHYLQARGVGPDVLVGMYCRPGFELLVGMLGILKAGGAYVPLDPSYPRDRVEFVVRDAEIPLLLTQADLKATLPGHAAEVICLDDDWPAIAAQPDEAPLCQACPWHLAYVIYTSGSTGQPKGALVTHANVSRLFTSTDHWFHFDQRDVWTLFHSYAFDFSVWEIWGALLYGGRLVIVPFLVSRAPTTFYELLRSEGVTVLNQTPSAFRQLMQVEVEQGPALDLALRLVIFGGEALNLASLCDWFTRHGDRRPQLVNMYGITETTVHVTYRPLTEADAREPRGSLIGQPIPDLALYVLDEHLQPVPIGVPGELFVGGAGLARGYLKRSELTRQRFIPSPFDPEGQERLYRTGDLVRYLPNLELDYLGRIDKQVKIRGFRIELGEIESVLSQHPAVREAIVVAREDTPGDQRLVAYLALHPSQSPTFGELRRHLKRALPDYMVPAAFITLEAIPLTHNGKVDYRALPGPKEGAAVAKDRSLAAPTTPIEGLLVTLWSEILNLSQVGVHDNFFEIGGHSLLATQVMSRLQERLQIEISLRDFFAAPTISALAAKVELARTTTAAPPLVPMPRGENLPLSFAQQRLWFLHQLEPNSAFYNVPVTFRFQGELHVPVLERCLTAVVERHEALRTIFHHDPLTNTVVQRIAPPSPVALPIVDFDEQAADEALWAWASQEVQRPFDLTCEPLLRAALLRHGPQDHVLVLTVHHIAFDEWSSGILFQELAALYAGMLDGKPVATLLPPLSVQYADFAIWQRHWLQGAVLEQQLDYWKSKLQGPLAVLDIPTDYARPASQTFNGAHERFTIPPELYAQLNELARREGVTLFMLLLAVWSTLLARYSGQDEVVVGTPIANRSRVEIEPLIGFFANSLALRTDLSGDPSFLELLQRVREVALDAYAHQDVPLDQIVSLVQPSRSLNRAPLFQVMLVLQNVTRESLSLSGCSIMPIAIENHGSRFELSLVLYEQQAQIVGWLEYNTDLFSQTTVRRMLAHLELLLASVVANPEQRIRQISLLSTAEQQQLLSQWNDQDDSYDLD